MRLALMTSLALPLAAAMTSEESTVQRNPKMMSWGTEKNLLSTLADLTNGEDMEDQPSYCTLSPPNPTCYRQSYPACCYDSGVECPEQRPPCECDGDCVACTHPDAAECGDDEFCMLPTGHCRLRSATIPGTCASKPEMCTMEMNSVCGCDGTTYPNPCAAQSAGVSVDQVGACPNNNRRPERPGSDYCTWSPDNDCFVNGWPQCCVTDGQDCPPDRRPRCDNQSGMGWDYCTWSPDESCYESGWPKCCERFGGTNCPTDKPNCDVSEDTVKVKFLRNGR